jgi:hypothetical protein
MHDKLFPTQSLDAMIKNYYNGKSYAILPSSEEVDALVNWSKVVNLVQFSLVGIKTLLVNKGIMPNDPTGKLAPCVWYGAVISYTNLFSQTKKSDIKLNYKAVFKNQSDRNHHLEIISLRNTLIAHRDESNLENGIVTVSDSGQITTFTHRQGIPPLKTLEIMKDLVYKIGDHADAKINKIMTRLKSKDKLPKF